MPFVTVAPTIAIEWSLDELAILFQLYSNRRVLEFQNETDYLTEVDLVRGLNEGSRESKRVQRTEMQKSTLWKIPYEIS